MDWWNELVRAERQAQGAALSKPGPVDPAERLEMTRQELMLYIEKAANIGHHAGFNAGWAKASVRHFGQVRWLRRALVMTSWLSLVLGGVVIWLLGR